MFENLRQYRYPKSFRISEEVRPDFAALLNTLNKLLVIEANQSTTDVSKERNLLKIIGDVGTIVWRLQKRSSAEIEPPEKVQRISRDIESACDILLQGNVEIKDHTGQIYNDGLRLRVLSFQPMPGLIRDQIIDTIKPTIFYNSKMIRMGEVIVGTPQNDITS